MEQSIWKKEVSLKQFESLSGNKRTEVLIIGGGIAGLMCAYFLKNAGVDCIVVDGNRIASGTTGNTTAKITYLHGLRYSKLMEQFGREKAEMYLKANRDAMTELERLAGKISCDFEKKPALTYSLGSREKLEREAEAIMELGGAAEFIEKSDLPFEICGAVRVPEQAQFNPMKFLNGIVQDLQIYENTQVREITPRGIVTEKGKISAEKIIVATHFPFINKHGGYFLKLYQHRSYVCAFENAQKLCGMFVDESLKGMSFRTYGDLLFIGGGAHRTGKQGGGFGEIKAFAAKYYHGAKLKYAWAAQDCMSLDGVPYIGKYSEKTPNLYVATGFNKWGMTSSVAAAKILCDEIMGKKNDCAEVFTPSRSILKPQLALNALESTVNLLTPTVPRCPHLGCALKWNRQEHSWDCPCHGSRFEEDGKLIDNPATGNAKIK